MPKQKVQLKKGEESFGERLEKLRRAAGYSQRELAADLGISQRMIVYYEKHNGQPSAPLLPKLSNVLGVSPDQLLGMKVIKTSGRARDTKLWRRFNQLEKLSPAQRKPIVQVIDAFIRGEKTEEA